MANETKEEPRLRPNDHHLRHRFWHDDKWRISVYDQEARNFIDRPESLHVPEDAMSSKFAVQTKSVLDSLILDTVWAWLVPREPLVTEEAVTDRCAVHTKNKSS